MPTSNLHEHLPELPRHSEKMPALFIGHGSPMNAIENNVFSRTWQQLGQTLPLPTAVLVISAHWLTRGTYVTAMGQPRTIHDFGGFPRALFEVQYPAPGHPQLAAETKKILTSTDVGLNHDWGLDHGAWSVVKQMYPDAHIPVVQLSIDYHKPAAYHYALGKQLATLRSKGVMIIGSGNMVHNLPMVDFEKVNEPGFGFDWAIEMNHVFKTHISEGNHKALVEYQKLNAAAQLAIPTPDHYYPLMYILALQQKKETPVFFNDYTVGGSLSMTSVQFG